MNNKSLYAGIFALAAASLGIAYNASTLDSSSGPKDLWDWGKKVIAGKVGSGGAGTSQGDGATSKPATIASQPDLSGSSVRKPALKTALNAERTSDGAGKKEPVVPETVSVKASKMVAPTLSLTQVSGILKMVSGSAAPGSEVSVTANGKTIGQTTADVNGKWSLALTSALKSGRYDLSVVTRDLKTKATAKLAKTVDLVVPAVATKTAAAPKDEPQKKATSKTEDGAAGKQKVAKAEPEETFTQKLEKRADELGKAASEKLSSILKRVTGQTDTGTTGKSEPEKKDTTRLAMNDDKAPASKPSDATGTVTGSEKNASSKTGTSAETSDATSSAKTTDQKTISDPAKPKDTKVAAAETKDKPAAKPDATTTDVSISKKTDAANTSATSNEKVASADKTGNVEQPDTSKSTTGSGDSAGMKTAQAKDTTTETKVPSVAGGAASDDGTDNEVSMIESARRKISELFGRTGDGKTTDKQVTKKDGSGDASSPSGSDAGDGVATAKSAAKSDNASKTAASQSSPSTGSETKKTAGGSDASSGDGTDTKTASGAKSVDGSATDGTAGTASKSPSNTTPKATSPKNGTTKAARTKIAERTKERARKNKSKRIGTAARRARSARRVANRRSKRRSGAPKGAGGYDLAFTGGDYKVDRSGRNRLVLTGRGVPGAKLSVFINGSAVVRKRVGRNGTWRVQSRRPLSVGTTIVEARMHNERTQETQYTTMPIINRHRAAATKPRWKKRVSSEVVEIISERVEPQVEYFSEEIVEPEVVYERDTTNASAAFDRGEIIILEQRRY